MRKKASVLLGMLLLAGCTKSITIESQDATELAMDTAGVTSEEVLKVSTSEDEGYIVEFETETGNYTYKVSYNGQVLSKKYVSNGKKKTKKKEDEEEIIAEPEFVAYDSSTATLEETNALDLALGNLRLGYANVTNILIKHELDNTILVQFTVARNGNVIISTINAEGNLVSSVIQ